MTDTMTMTLVILIKTFDMKRYLIAIFVTILALASCAKDLDECRIIDNNAIDQVTTVLTFTGERPQLDPTTKTAWDAGTESIVWSANDKIKIGFTFNGNWWSQNAAASQNNKIKFYQSNAVAIDSENPSVGTFTVPSGFTGPTTSGDYVFYAVYPGPKIESDQINTAEIPIILNPNQVPAADSFDPATDILVGKSRTVTSAGLPTDPLTIFWTRVVAHGNFTLKNFQDVDGFDDGETISKVIFTAQEGANLAGKENLSVTDGKFSGTQISNVITLDGSNLSFVTGADNKTNLNVWLSVIPTTITSLDVVVETDKATYHKSWSSISKELKGNARNTMGINMATATRTAKTEYYWVLKDISNIRPNDVFVIVGNNGSTYAMTNNNGTSNAPSAPSVTVSGNRLTTNPGTDIQWTLSKDGDKYTFHPVNSKDTWLYLSGNSVRVGTNSNKYFTINHGNPGEYLTNLYNTTNNYYLLVNNTWGLINNTWGLTRSYPNQTIAFYVRVDAASHREHDITFSKDTYNRNVNGYTSSFDNNCDGLSLTLTNINNGNSSDQWTTMRAGRKKNASVATITTKDAIPEVIRSVTLTITNFNSSSLNSLKLIVSPTSDFSSTTEYEFDGIIPGEAWATITEPEAYMYYKIVIDHRAAYDNGLFRFNRIVYSE